MTTRRDVSRAIEPVAEWGRWSQTARARVPPSWFAELRRDPLLRRARVVVDVVIGRKRVLASTVPLRSTSLDGGVRIYRQDLMDEPELIGMIELRISEPQARSVSVSLRGSLLDLPAIIASGHPLGGQGDVALLVDGMRWEDRVVYVRGPINITGFGGNDELVDVTISDPQVATIMVPPWTINRARWPNAPDSAIGEVVPVVLSTMPKAPCPHIASTGSHDRFLVGYGNLTVSTVWVDGVVSAAGTVTQMNDQLGLPVTIIEFAPGVVDETTSVHATAKPADLTRRTLVETIRKLLAELGNVSGERLNDRLFSEASVRLADVGATASGRTSPLVVINEETRIIDFLSDLLSDWPMVSMVWDGAGLGPVIIDHRAEPVARLERGVYPMLDRPNGARYEPTPTTDLRTSFKVRHSYDMLKDVWAGLAVRHPENSALCRLALALTEVEQQEPDIEALSIGDEPTAHMIIDWLVEHLARPSIRATVAAFPEAFLTLREGDTIRWTDPTVGMTDTPGIVLSRRYGPPSDSTRVELGLQLFPGLSGQLSGQTRL